MLTVGDNVTWAGHRGVYIVMKVALHHDSIEVRQRGHVAPVEYAGRSKLTPLTEAEAVARMIADAHERERV